MIVSPLIPQVLCCICVMLLRLCSGRPMLLIAIVTIWSQPVNIRNCSLQALQNRRKSDVRHLHIPLRKLSRYL
jgi:hypothetical protein